MEKWLSRFTGHNPYLLEINNSSIKPDVLRLYGREALKETLRWEIEFTCAWDITVQDMMMKFASISMRSGKTVHGTET